MHLESAAVSTSPPIYSLPPEILFQIFQYLLQRPRDTRYQHLIPVTHTSSALRHVATSVCPGLWTVITIGNKTRTFIFAMECLQRSGRQKLDVKISVSRDLSKKLSAIIRFLRLAAPRTRSLKLVVAISKDVYRRMLNDCLGSMELPALEFLELDLWTRKAEGVAPCLVPLPPSMPSLLSLNLMQLAPESGFEALGSLRHLSLWSRSFWSCSLHSIYRALEECKLLEILVIDRRSSLCHEKLEPKQVWIPEHPLALPNLRLVKFREVERSFMAWLLGRIEAPKLDTLELILEEETHITSNHQLRWENLPTIRTFPHVSTLCIGYSPSTLPRREQPGLTTCLFKMFPHVRRVELPFRDDDFLQVWRRSWEEELRRPYPDRSLFWNHLRQLSIGRCAVHSGTDCWRMMKSAKMFARKRIEWGLAPLENVTVHVCGEVIQATAGGRSTILADLSKLLGSPGQLKVRQAAELDEDN